MSRRCFLVNTGKEVKQLMADYHAQKLTHLLSSLHHTDKRTSMLVEKLKLLIANDAPAEVVEQLVRQLMLQTKHSDRQPITSMSNLQTIRQIRRELTGFLNLHNYTGCC